mmetsp:Transcript_43185/g.101528  ORF Transcript_43185/g.101528 Transcript_43185/m.101528 type:complete len:290 (-) Transcript_43185:651-1520(-)
MRHYANSPIGGISDRRGTIKLQQRATAADLQMSQHRNMLQCSILLPHKPWPFLQVVFRRGFLRLLITESNGLIDKCPQFLKRPAAFGNVDARQALGLTKAWILQLHIQHAWMYMGHIPHGLQTHRHESIATSRHRHSCEHFRTTEKDRTPDLHIGQAGVVAYPRRSVVSAHALHTCLKQVLSCEHVEDILCEHLQILLSRRASEELRLLRQVAEDGRTPELLLSIPAAEINGSTSNTFEGSWILENYRTPVSGHVALPQRHTSNGICRAKSSSGERHSSKRLGVGFLLG